MKYNNNNKYNNFRFWFVFSKIKKITSRNLRPKNFLNFQIFLQIEGAYIFVPGEM